MYLRKKKAFMSNDRIATTSFGLIIKAETLYSGLASFDQ